MLAIPKEKWRVIRPENAHITMHFLGYIQEKAIMELKEKAAQLENFGSFEAELAGIGRFKNRVLWLGVGSGAEEMSLLSKKLCSAIGLREEKFHPHVTLARNRGSRAEETDRLIESLREKAFREKISVDSLELMESILHRAGPEYKTVFSVRLNSQQ